MAAGVVRANSTGVLPVWTLWKPDIGVKTSDPETTRPCAAWEKSVCSAPGTGSETGANMKRIAITIATALLGLLALPVGLLFPSGVFAAPSAQAQIEAVLHAQQDAWNRGEVEAFLQGYWHSPELTFSGSGGTMRGWDGVLARYRKSYPDRASMGQLAFSGLEFRQLGPTAYLVLGSWHLTRASGDVGGVFTLIFERFPEGWRIIHDHTSAVPRNDSH